MANNGKSGFPLRRTKRLVMGEPWELSGYTVQPVAQARAWHWTKEDGQAGGGVVRLKPVEVIVRDANGGERRVSLPPPNRAPLLGMWAGAAAVAAVCSLAMLVISLLGAQRQAARWRPKLLSMKLTRR